MFFEKWKMVTGDDPAAGPYPSNRPGSVLELDRELREIHAFPAAATFCPFPRHPGTLIKPARKVNQGVSRCIKFTTKSDQIRLNELRFLLREPVTPELSLSGIEPQQKPRWTLDEKN